MAHTSISRYSAWGITPVDPTAGYIKLSVTVSGWNNTLLLNKYFQDNYTVDWGDGSAPQEISTWTWHKYIVNGTYEVVLSSTWRWKFDVGNTQALCPYTEGVVTDVTLIAMPILQNRFGDSASAVGNNFFAYFNSAGVIESMSGDFFDTSYIQDTGQNFFRSFNEGWFLTSLPNNSFDTKNIVNLWDYAFASFNSGGNISVLPAGSFQFGWVTWAMGTNVFDSFMHSAPITWLPAGSFNFTNTPTSVGAKFFEEFGNGSNLVQVSPWDGVPVKNIAWYDVNFYYSGGYETVSSWNEFRDYAIA